VTDNDLFEFMRIFKSLVMVFPVRGDEQEVRDMGGTYFKAFKRYPLEYVRQGSENCVLVCKKFPKPAEWIGNIPAQRVRPELDQLSPAETAEYLDAEERKYDGEPCHCPACRAAGVDHRFLRFVPNFDSHGNESRALLGEREVVKGHWAHGEELRHWYAMKEHFWAQYQQATNTMDFSDAV
jgi:hypothetical protein